MNSDTDEGNAKQETSDEEFILYRKPKKRKRLRRGRPRKKVVRTKRHCVNNPEKLDGKWFLESKFPNEKSAVGQLIAEEIWSVDISRSRTTSLSDGRKLYYRCNRATASGPRCYKLKCIFVPANGDPVSLYTTKSVHDHDKNSPPMKAPYKLSKVPNAKLSKQVSRRLEVSLKTRVIKLMKRLNSSNAILRQLESEGYKVRNRIGQIRSYWKYARTRIHNWIFEKSFNDIDEAKFHVKNEQIWSCKFQNRSHFGLNYHYRCNLVPKDGPQCAARKYFAFNRFTNEINLYKMDSPHTHSEILRSPRKKITNKTDKLLNHLNECDQDALRKQGFRVLDAVGLQNCRADPNIANDEDLSFHDKLFMLQSSQENELILESRIPTFSVDWYFEKKFPNEQMALDHLKQDNNWIVDAKRAYNVNGGRKVHYRCNWVKLNGPQCATRKCLFYFADSEEVLLYQKNGEHTHDSIPAQFRMTEFDLNEQRQSLLHTSERRLRQGRPLKYARISVDVEEDADTFNESVGIAESNIEHKYNQTTLMELEPVLGAGAVINDTTEPVVTDNRGHTAAIELVTGDDATQYVINYIDEDQAENFENVTPKVTKDVTPLTSESTYNWKFENSFADFPAAEVHLQKDSLLHVKTTRVRGQYRRYYRCNVISNSGVQCGARAYSLQDTNNVLVYRNLKQHSHDLEIKQVVEPKLSDSSMEVDQQINYENTIPAHMSHSGTTSHDNNYSWNCEKSCATFNEALEYLKKDHFSQVKTTRVNGQYRKYYRCKLYNKLGQKCEARAYGLQCDETDRILVYRNLTEHTHDEENNASETKSQRLKNIQMSSEFVTESEGGYSSKFCSMGFDKQLEWRLEDKIPTNDKVSEYLSKHKTWHCKYHSGKSSKIYYSCTTVKCEAQMCLYYDKRSSEVSVYRCGSHNHSIAYLTQDIPLQLTGTSLPAESFPDSETIVKEELMINDEPVTNIQVEYSGGDNGTNEFIVVTRPPTPEIVVPPVVPVNPAPIIFDIDYEGEQSTSHNNVIITAPILNRYTFQGEFVNLTDAMNYMRQEADHYDALYIRTKHIKNKYHQYFRCNYNNAPEGCPCRMLLLGDKTSIGPVLYYVTTPHIHLASPVPQPMIQTIPTSVIPSESTTEIVISDDSDKDSLNGDDVENRGEWIYETKFNNYKTAKEFIKTLNLLSFKSNITKNGVTEYYNCNVSTSGEGHCPASRYLQYENLTSSVLMYTRDVRHVANCINALPPLVPIEKESACVIDLVDSDDNEPNVIMLTESDDESNNTEQKDDFSLGGDKKWIFEKSFASSKEGQDYLKDEQIWTFKVRSKSKEGVKEYYRCNLGKAADIECASAKFLHTKYGTKPSVFLYTTVQNHTHDIDTKGAQAFQIYDSLDEGTKSKIKEFILIGNTPKQILDKLQFKDGGQSQYEKHLYYWIQRLRRTIRGHLTGSLPFLKTVENWLSQITGIPRDDDEHEHYCVSYHVDHVTKSFRCFLSTRRLLKNALDSNLVHVDSTYVLRWQQHPVTIIGTTDLDHHFHIFGIAICSHLHVVDFEFMFKAIRKGVIESHNKLYKPDCIMADDNEAVCSAFINTFGPLSKVGTCSKVALSKIFLKCFVTLKTDPLRVQIEDDINKIQRLSSQELFSKAIELFFRKWRKLNNEPLTEFLNYFKSNWVDRNNNWFQGFRPFTPHTNKAIRDEYELLRKSLTSKRFLAIESFRYHIQNDVKNLSRCYSRSGTKHFVRKPTVPQYIYDKAIKWKNSEKQFEVVHDIFETRYYIPAGDESEIDDAKFLKYRECNHPTLKEFFDIQFSFWYVTRSNNSGTISCNCPYFLENFVCEHSVGMAFILNIMQIRSNTANIVNSTL